MLRAQRGGERLAAGLPRDRQCVPGCAIVTSCSTAGARACASKPARARVPAPSPCPRHGPRTCRRAPCREPRQPPSGGTSGHLRARWWWRASLAAALCQGMPKCQQRVATPLSPSPRRRPRAGPTPVVQRGAPATWACPGTIMPAPEGHRAQDGFGTTMCRGRGAPESSRRPDAPLATPPRCSCPSPRIAGGGDLPRVLAAPGAPPTRPAPP